MFDLNKIKNKDAIIFETFDNKTKKGVKTYKTSQIEPFPKGKTNINKKLDLLLKTNKKVIICQNNRYQINKIIEELENSKIVYTNENEKYPQSPRLR